MRNWQCPVPFLSEKQEVKIHKKVQGFVKRKKQIENLFNKLLICKTKCDNIIVPLEKGSPAV